jgi:hypothetical protein
MELRKPSEIVEFKYEDVIFLVKAEASEEDRMEVALLGRRDESGKLHYSNADLCRSVIARMVTGWKNVKSNGIDVAYSIEALSMFPAVAGHNVYLELGGFILEKTNILKGASEEKKNA